MKDEVLKMLKEGQAVDVIVEIRGKEYEIFRFSRHPAIWNDAFLTENRKLITLDRKVETLEELDSYIREIVGLSEKNEEEKEVTEEVIEEREFYFDNEEDAQKKYDELKEQGFKVRKWFRKSEGKWIVKVYA